MPKKLTIKIPKPSKKSLPAYSPMSSSVSRKTESCSGFTSDPGMPDSMTISGETVPSLKMLDAENVSIASTVDTAVSETKARGMARPSLMIAVDDGEIGVGIETAKSTCEYLQLAGGERSPTTKKLLEHMVAGTAGITTENNLGRGGDGRVDEIKVVAATDVALSPRHFASKAIYDVATFDRAQIILQHLQSKRDFPAHLFNVALLSEPGSHSLFFPLCRQGCLQQLSDKIKLLVAREEPSVLDYLYHQICRVLQAVTFMHSAGVVHLDIKAPNKLLDDRMGVKLADFCSSAFIADLSDEVMASLRVGTSIFMAPEMLAGELTGTDPRLIDVWNIGVLFAQLLGLTEHFSLFDSKTHSTDEAQMFFWSKSYLKDLKVVRRAKEAIDSLHTLLDEFGHGCSFASKLFILQQVMQLMLLPARQGRPEAAKLHVLLKAFSGSFACESSFAYRAFIDCLQGHDLFAAEDPIEEMRVTL